jgi:hypothetical protein
VEKGLETTYCTCLILFFNVSTSLELEKTISKPGDNAYINTTFCSLAQVINDLKLSWKIE